MDKKYQILSVSSLFPLVVTLKTENNDELLNISVKIDYQNDKVYFDNCKDYKDLDFNLLEQQILDHFKPPHVDIPDVYYEHLSKIQEVKAGNYGNYATSFMKDYDNNTKGEEK